MQLKKLGIDDLVGANQGEGCGFAAVLLRFCLFAFGYSLWRSACWWACLCSGSVGVWLAVVALGAFSATATECGARVGGAQ
jgi:hypothetical protein